MTTSAPARARVKAKMRPSRRAAPVIKTIMPFKGNSVIIGNSTAGLIQACNKMFPEPLDPLFWQCEGPTACEPTFQQLVCSVRGKNNPQVHYFRQTRHQTAEFCE